MTLLLQLPGQMVVDGDRTVTGLVLLAFWKHLSKLGGTVTLPLEHFDIYHFLSYFRNKIPGACGSWHINIQSSLQDSSTALVNPGWHCVAKHPCWDIEVTSKVSIWCLTFLNILLVCIIFENSKIQSLNLYS